MKGLIVTADDFGAAVEVNEAVERAHRDGILTAASLMVSAAAAADAIRRAKAVPSLRVGLHLVLVEGRPTLPASAIPDLVAGDGMFRNDMARAGTAMFFRPRLRRQLAAEIRAQFEAFRTTGLALDHVNAHKHFHLHPTIASLIRKIGKDYGMRAVRVPLEPADVLLKIDPKTQGSLGRLTAPFAKRQRRLFARAGILSPDHVFGLHWSGAMTKERLCGIVEHLPEGLSEIYLHPATGPYPGSAPGYRYRDEFEALIDPQVIELTRSTGIRCGGFADFLSSPEGARVGAPTA